MRGVEKLQGMRGVDKTEENKDPYVTRNKKWLMCTLCNEQPLNNDSSVFEEPNRISANDRPPDMDWQARKIIYQTT